MDCAARERRESRTPLLSDRTPTGVLWLKRPPQTRSAIKMARASHRVLNAGPPTRAWARSRSGR
eukprot:1407447-Alexandrium_andersonii.AAC.1